MRQPAKLPGLHRLLGTAALAAAFVFAGSPARASWWEDASVAKRTTLADIASSPERWRDVPVLLDVRIDVGAAAPAAGAASAAFDDATWRRVRLVPFRRGADGAAVADTSAAFERAFVLRGSAEELRVSLAGEGVRAAVRATVRDVASGSAWIEVLDVTAEGEGLTPEEDARVRHAERLLASDSPVAAETVLRDVLAGRDYGDTVRAQLWRLLGRACRSQRRFAEAVTAFRCSLALEPDDAPTAADLKAAEDRTKAKPRDPAAPQAETFVARGTPIPVPSATRKLSGPRNLGNVPPADTPVDAPSAAPAPTARNAPSSATPAVVLPAEPEAPPSAPRPAAEPR